MQSASSELARDALEAAPDAMVIVDTGGTIRYANRQVTALFGHAHEEVIGLCIERLLPERFRDGHVGHRHEYMTHRRVRPMGLGLDLYGLHRDGTEFPVEISLSPIGDGERVLVAAAIRDATERKRIERELVAARASAEQAREAADRANQGKSRFLATASHDLRQPLQTLALLNGTLRRTVTDEGAVEALSQQEEAIGAMSRLLNALLDISKLESGAVKPEPEDFAVAGIFEELRREFAGIAGGAEAIVIPEAEQSPEAVATAIRDAYQRGKSHAIVIVAEGAKHDADTLARYFTEHAERLGFELRVTKLGHVQRGGAPCVFDRLSATLLGAAAVEHLAAGQHGVLLGIVGGRVTASALADVIHAVKPLDAHLIQLAQVLSQ